MVISGLEEPVSIDLIEKHGKIRPRFGICYLNGHKSLFYLYRYAAHVCRIIVNDMTHRREELSHTKLTLAAELGICEDVEAYNENILCVFIDNNPGAIL